MNVNVAQGFRALGVALANDSTTIAQLVNTAREVGLVIQFRVVPFQDTLYNLTTSESNHNGEDSNTPTTNNL